MKKIKILPEEVVVKIAAGEVVERPASVVKELIENSLDAGATGVSLTILDGGKNLIRVADNGHGISPLDMKSLFKSHATSKISTVDDLTDIRTLGFRGEALWAVSSVSQMTVTSRVKGMDEAYTIGSNGGEVSGVEPCSAPEGTVVEARNLFFNTPARLKFLRNSRTEYAHVWNVFERFLLSYPNVRFTFTSDDGPESVFARTENIRERFAEVVDPETAAKMVLVEAGGDVVESKAYVAPPQFARENARLQYVFLDGRYVRDRVTSKAVVSAFREHLVHGLEPIYFVFLKVDPRFVDVNVHPSKLEVKYRSTEEVYNLVFNSIRKSLDSRTTTAPLDVHRFADKSSSTQEIVQYAREPSRIEFGGTPAPNRLITGKRFFQIHKKFIIEELEDGFLVIDQHALHERVLLEKFRREFTSTHVAKQLLLLPALVHVSPEELLLLEENKQILESVGLAFDDLGPDQIKVKSVPAILRDDHPAEIVKGFLDLTNEGKARVPGIERVMEFVACRGAVKFGDHLSDEEIAGLLEYRQILDNPHSCAHGRPVALKITLAELEKLFKRRI